MARKELCLTDLRLTRRRFLMRLALVLGSASGIEPRALAQGTPVDELPTGALHWQDLDASSTALVVVDPYNDFLSFPGKAWVLNRETIHDNKAMRNIAKVLEAFRLRRMLVTFAPHARYVAGIYDSRRFLNPSIYLAKLVELFKKDSWGGRFHRDLRPRMEEFVASEHLTSSGFVNTDLHEKLESVGIETLVLCGCLSNTCIESTARSAIELGYQVVIIEDALVAQSAHDHAAAVESSFPLICHSLVRTQDFLT